MKRVSLLIAVLCGLFAFAAAAGPPQLTCCEKAKADGQECKHKCCVAAHKDGKSCVKCNPNKEDLKLLKKDTKKGSQK